MKKAHCLCTFSIALFLYLYQLPLSLSCLSHSLRMHSASSGDWQTKKRLYMFVNLKVGELPLLATRTGKVYPLNLNTRILRFSVSWSWCLECSAKPDWQQTDSYHRLHGMKTQPPESIKLKLLKYGTVYWKKNLFTVSDTVVSTTV